MKLKIVNRKRFNIFIILVITCILFCISICFNNSYSKGIIKNKEEYIYEGDTLWSIAQKEAKNSKYYENEDIRNIISELKTINHIEDGNLQIGQKIMIPTFNLNSSEYFDI